MEEREERVAGEERRGGRERGREKDGEEEEKMNKEIAACEPSAEMGMGREEKRVHHIS